jgi:hypothetical protein
MRKVAAILLVIACIGAGVIFVAMKRVDVHHTSERRLWKDTAIMKIKADLKATDYLEKRFGEIPKPLGFFDSSEQWLTPDTIVCRDASWLAYRAQCHKEDPKVHDIFVAKASDGKWYYSDFHFCIDMMTLGSNGQPASLKEFKHLYFLHEFDGVSDAALDPTWIPRGELRYPDQGEQDAP